MNRTINGRVEVIWWLLGDPVPRSWFARGERGWRQYVGNNCASRSGAWIAPSNPHSYVGGTSAPLRAAACEQELSAAHLRDLDAMISELCTGRATPACKGRGSTARG